MVLAKQQFTDSGLLEATLTNKAGANTVVGYVYRLDPDNDESFDYASEDEDAQVCVAQVADIADASTTSVVLAGVCEVYLDGVTNADISLGLKFLSFSHIPGQTRVGSIRHDGTFGEALEDSSGAGVSTCMVYQRERIRKWSWFDEESWKRTGVSPYKKSTWNLYSGNPIITNGAVGSWDATGAQAPCVVYRDGTFFLYYTGANAASRYQIGLATSTDGINFTKYGGNPIIVPAGSGTDYHDGFPSVIYDEWEADPAYRWKMWYLEEVDARTESYLAYAYSSDGYSWTKYAGNPVAHPYDLYWGLTVIRVGELYCAYVGRRDGAPLGGLNLLVSDDGITWSHYGEVLAKGSAVSKRYATMFKGIDAYYLVYCCNSGNCGGAFMLHMAINFNPFTTFIEPTVAGTYFEIIDQAVGGAWHAQGVWSPAILAVRDNFLLYFSGGANPGIWGQIGLAYLHNVVVP